jgi:DNA-binding XRE family transcriptional regulator
MSEWQKIVQEVEEEAGSQGAEAEIAALRGHFRLGAELLERRLELGMTQIQLEKAAGVPQSEISRIERGRANPTVHTVRAMADALDADIELVPRYEIASEQ